MRTTLTIDDDLMPKIKKMAFETGKPVKEIVNNLLRRGLQSSDKKSNKKKYTCPEYPMGNPANYDIDHALKVAESLETDEIVRKIHLRK